MTDDHTANVEARIAALHPDRNPTAPDPQSRDAGLYAIARLRSFWIRHGVKLSQAQREFLGTVEKNHGAKITGTR
jgi:hypothetical protein